MKEKIKLMVLGAFIFYVLGVIGLIVYNGYMLYYSKVVLVGFIFLIFYTCLCFSKKDKVLKKTK